MTFQEWREDHQRRWDAIVSDREAGRLTRDEASRALGELEKEAFKRLHPIPAAGVPADVHTYWQRGWDEEATGLPVPPHSIVQ